MPREIHDTINGLEPIPVNPLTAKREEVLSGDIFQRRDGDVLIRPVQLVETLYQLLEGKVRVVKDLGTSREKEFGVFERRHDPKDPEGWTPIFGRYFFTQRMSTMHYIVVGHATVAQIAPWMIKDLYRRRECVKLVREIFRNSEVPLEVLSSALDERYAMFFYPGFRKEELAGLLRDAYVEGGEETRGKNREMVRKAYSDFACEVIYLLMGNQVEEHDFAEDTQIKPPRNPIR